MNPLVLFDYVFYSIASLYNKWGYEAQKEFVGVLFLSLLQLFNVVVLYGIIYNPLTEFNKFNPVIIYIGGYIILFLLNLLRYKRNNNYTVLQKKWENDTPQIKTIKIISVAIYVIITLFV